MRRSRRPFLLAATVARRADPGRRSRRWPRPQPASTPAVPAAVTDAPLRRRSAGGARPRRPGAVGARSPWRCAARTPTGSRGPSPGCGDRPADGDAIVTPAEFGDRFGLPRADEDQLVATLTAAGLTVTQRVPQRTSWGCSGTVADLERVFGLTLEQLPGPADRLHVGRRRRRRRSCRRALAGACRRHHGPGAAAAGQRHRRRGRAGAAHPRPDARDLARAYDFEPLWKAGLHGGGPERRHPPVRRGHGRGPRGLRRRLRHPGARARADLGG